MSAAYRSDALPTVLHPRLVLRNGQEKYDKLGGGDDKVQERLGGGGVGGGDHGSDGKTKGL